MLDPKVNLLSNINSADYPCQGHDHLILSSFFRPYHDKLCSTRTMLMFVVLSENKHYRKKMQFNSFSQNSFRFSFSGFSLSFYSILTCCGLTSAGFALDVSAAKKPPGPSDSFRKERLLTKKTERTEEAPQYIFIVIISILLISLIEWEMMQLKTDDNE